MYIIIINPVASNGSTNRFYKKIIKNEDLQHISFQTYYTEYEGHAEKIILELLNKFSPTEIKAIIVFGGDGTMNEVLNGVNVFGIPVSFIPGGSGNDFARGVPLDKNPNKILHNILSKDKKTSYSLGQYYLKSEKEIRKFINCIGFGFDAVVAKSANESKLKKILNNIKLGPISYLFELIKQLFFYKPITITIEMDGKSKTLDRKSTRLNSSHVATSYAVLC